MEEARGGVGQGGRLLGDGLDQAGVGVAQVHRHEAAGEVQIPAPFRVVEPASFPPDEEGRVQLPLRQPGGEDVSPVQGFEVYHRSTTTFLWV
ncbi:hypothetical protein GCM10007092_21820 [Thermus composti]|nr:hypothetical protein GCM10007092_21820 [Thermus composti]